MLYVQRSPWLVGSPRVRLVRGTGGLELCIPRGLTQVAAHAQASTSLGLVVLLFLPKRIVYRGQGDPERGGTWDENKRKSCLFLCLFAPLNFRLQTRFSIANKSIRSSAANTFFGFCSTRCFFWIPTSFLVLEGPVVQRPVWSVSSSPYCRAHCRSKQSKITSSKQLLGRHSLSCFFTGRNRFKRILSYPPIPARTGHSLGRKGTLCLMTAVSE